MEALSLSICACCAAIALFCCRIELFHSAADGPAGWRLPEMSRGASVVILSASDGSASGLAGRVSFVMTLGFALEDADFAFCFSRLSRATSPRDWPNANELTTNALDTIFKANRIIAPRLLLMRTLLIIVAPFGWIAKRRQ